MASTYINMDGSASRLAGKMRNLVDQARSMQEITTSVKRIMDTAKDAPEDVDASFVTLGGLLGVSSAKAREAYNLLVAFQTVINKPNYDSFIDRLG
jgi:hypothetical protein